MFPIVFLVLKNALGIDKQLIRNNNPCDRLQRVSFLTKTDLKAKRLSYFKKVIKKILDPFNFIKITFKNEKGVKNS